MSWESRAVEKISKRVKVEADYGSTSTLIFGAMMAWLFMVVFILLNNFTIRSYLEYYFENYIVESVLYTGYAICLMLSGLVISSFYVYFRKPDLMNDTSAGGVLRRDVNFLIPYTWSFFENFKVPIDQGADKASHTSPSPSLEARRLQTLHPNDSNTDNITSDNDTATLSKHSADLSHINSKNPPLSTINNATCYEIHQSCQKDYSPVIQKYLEMTSRDSCSPPTQHQSCYYTHFRINENHLSDNTYNNNIYGNNNDYNNENIYNNSKNNNNIYNNNNNNNIYNNNRSNIIYNSIYNNNNSIYNNNENVYNNDYNIYNNNNNDYNIYNNNNNIYNNNNNIYNNNNNIYNNNTHDYNYNNNILHDNNNAPYSDSHNQINNGSVYANSEAMLGHMVNEYGRQSQKLMLEGEEEVLGALDFNAEHANLSMRNTSPLSDFPKYESMVVSSDIKPSSKSNGGQEEELLKFYCELAVNVLQLDEWADNVRIWMARRLFYQVSEWLKCFESKYGRETMFAHQPLLEGIMPTLKTQVIGNQGFVHPGGSNTVLNEEQKLFCSWKMQLDRWMMDFGTNREYVIERIHVLSSNSSCLKNYVWDGGGDWKGSCWTNDLATDAFITAHLFCSYVDEYLCALDPAHRADLFSSEHFKQFNKLTSKHYRIAIYEKKHTPPHYNLTYCNIDYSMKPGRNNLFVTIALFLFIIKKKHSGLVESVSLKNSGLLDLVPGDY